MSDQHYQAIAEFLLEDGREIVIGDETVRGMKKRLGYEESRELALMPGAVSYRVTVAKSGMVFVPARGLKVVIDGKRFTLGTTDDLVTCYRFVISRNGK